MFGAASVVEATRLFEQHRPDLIIVDPTVAGGFEFMDQVRSGLKPPRIVALVDSDEDRERVKSAGVELTLDKAAGLDGLVDAIRSSLSGSLAVQVGGNSTRILVADDEEGMRTLLVDYLSSSGYQAFAARDGREAVEFVADDPLVRLVLLDVSMPRMGGLEALRQIMMGPVHPDVIMMTAVTDREIAKQTLNLGAFDYVLKPFDLNSMEASIVACLGYADYHKRPWWKRLVRRSA
jgi:DNA-binding response OmpR family regulator